MTMGRAKYTSEQFVTAIDGSGAIISTIAKRVGCSWAHARNYIFSHPTVKRAYEDESNKVDDLAESTVLKAIQEHDVATAKWWLSKKRKDKFGDSLDVTSDGERIPITTIEVIKTYERPPEDEGENG